MVKGNVETWKFAGFDMKSTFGSASLKKSDLLWMTVFYVFFGGASFILDLLINHTDYEIPELKWILIAVSTGMLISCLNLIVSRFTPAGRHLRSMLKEMLAGSSLFFLLLMIVVGSIAEEIAFRALALEWLMRYLAPWISIILTSLVFGFLHGFFRPPLVLWSVTAFSWGVILGYFMYLSGLILVPITMHITVNVLAVIFLRYDFYNSGLFSFLVRHRFLIRL